MTFLVFFLGVYIYIRITPYDDISLIREGNNAAAISLAGAVLGLALPLGFAMASSISVWEILFWGSVTLLIQLVAYKITDLILRDISQRIRMGEIGAALLLVSFKLALAIMNAAAVAG
uniref:Predicted membrane protein n=1 Tax=uncultured nuHF1 cluster bacterium HF0770_35I22 TaxID=723586 RepID=E7C7Q0_9BACT|nr:predicted membrane protein [uncultured nuHF1 cluster bacterium HF0770_35I22]